MRSGIPNVISHRRTLVVMVKSPKAGNVKTRLSRDIGTIPATFFYRHMVNNVISRLAADNRWQTILAVTPDTDILKPYWPLDIARIEQGSGDLGQRMQHVMDITIPGPTVIIGTDIPEITPSHIEKAFKALGNSDAVFGPSDDGGYWLVGLKRTPRIRSVFNNVRWSSEFTLQDTLQNLKSANVEEIMVLRDVDNGKEYHDLKDFGSRLII